MIEPVVVSLIYLIFYVIFFGNMFFNSDAKIGLINMELQNKKSISQIFFVRSVVLLLMGVVFSLLIHIYTIIFAYGVPILRTQFLPGFFGSLFSGIILLLFLCFITFMANTFTSVIVFGVGVLLGVSPFLAMAEKAFLSEAQTCLADVETLDWFQQMEQSGLSRLITYRDTYSNERYSGGNQERNYANIFWRDYDNIDDYINYNDEWEQHFVTDFEKNAYFDFFQPFGTLLDTLVATTGKTPLAYQAQFNGYLQKWDLTPFYNDLQQHADVVANSALYHNMQVKNITQFTTNLTMMVSYLKEFYYDHSRSYLANPGNYKTLYGDFAFVNDRTKYALDRLFDMAYFYASYLLKNGTVLFADTLTARMISIHQYQYSVNVADVKKNYWTEPGIWAFDFQYGLAWNSAYYYQTARSWGGYNAKVYTIERDEEWQKNHADDYAFNEYKITGITRITNYGFEFGITLFCIIALYGGAYLAFRRRNYL
jgi:hypothetical protein